MTITLRFLTATFFLWGVGATAPAETARGIVFDDQNGNRMRDEGEPGLPGVAVSNGTDIVRTDDAGRYSLSVGDDTPIFIRKPAGWMTPVNRNQLPQFYYIHKPSGSPALKFPGVAPTGPLPSSIDFPLRRRAEKPVFQVVAFGDPQPYNLQEVHYYAHDIVEEVIGVDAEFGVSLGDLVGDDLSMFGPLNNATGTIGLPWYHILGNHDLNFDAPDDATSDETFEGVYGPAYYSFDYANVHFVVLDDVRWIGPQGDQKGRYVGAFGETQLAWLRQDLALTPDDQLVVVCFHIPLPDVQESERDAFLAVMKSRRSSLSLAAHWHQQGLNERQEDDIAARHAGHAHDHAHATNGADHTHAHDDHHGVNQSGAPRHQSFDGHQHFVVGTASGSWWRGIPDEYGIPHTQMRDGAPNGWLLMRFENGAYSWRYKAARRPWSHQMSIHTPDAVTVAASANTAVTVNFFVGRADDRVEMRIGGGPWSALTRTERVDPYYAELLLRETAMVGVFRKVPDANPCPHLWEGVVGRVLPPGGHVIEVRATDRFGQVFEGKRIIQVME